MEKKYIQTVAEYRTDLWEVRGSLAPILLETPVAPFQTLTKARSLVTCLDALNDYYYDSWGKKREGTFARVLSEADVLREAIQHAPILNLQVLTNNYLHTPSSAIYRCIAGQCSYQHLGSNPGVYGRTLTLEPGTALVNSYVDSSSRLCGDTGIVHCHGRLSEITRLTNVLLAGGNPSISSRPNSLLHLDDGISAEIEKVTFRAGSGVNALTINGYYAPTNLVSQVTLSDCTFENGNVLIIGSPEKDNPVVIYLENTELPDKVEMRGFVSIVYL